MACHFSDLDVFPLVEGIEPTDKKRWKKLEQCSRQWDRETGVFVETWFGKDMQANVIGKVEPQTVAHFKEMGPENIIQSEAILVDGHGIPLPVRVEKPAFRGNYTIGAYARFRGEDPKAQKARIRYEREQRQRRVELLRLLQETLPPLALGELEKPLAAFLFIDNFIPPKGGIYNRFEFLLHREADVRGFLGGMFTYTDLLPVFHALGHRLRTKDTELIAALLSLRQQLHPRGFSVIFDGHFA